MEKDAIFSERKQIKQAGHRAMRQHYFLLVFLCLALAMFGTEFNAAMTGITHRSEIVGVVRGEEPLVESIFSVDDIYSDIVSGRLDEGLEKQLQRRQQLAETADDSAFAARSRGIFAEFANTILSGSIITKAAQAVRSITHSDDAVAVVFIIGSLLWYVLAFVFLKNVFSAVVRRPIMEARVYERVSYLDVLHFAAVRKWVRASLTLALTSLLELAWMLTIVGGVVKYYSYWAVPWIVAENPAIKPGEAIRLSRRMMNGHKLELFRFQVTLLGWYALSVLTMGLSDLLYGIGYRMSCYADFYARVRAQALEKQLEGAQALDDPYLFEKADRTLLYECYFDVVDRITLLHENSIEVTGWRRRLLDWFGLWIGDLDEKKWYDSIEAHRFALETNQSEMRGLSYPNRLNPRMPRRGKEKQTFSWVRSYSVWSLFLIFIIVCFIGWSWEVSLHLISNGELVNRGTLYGPWLPIYGTGGVVVMMLLNRFKRKPPLEFFSAVALCGVLEYVTAWALETSYGQRWWSYDGYFLNLHGRVCAEGLLVFGVGCCTLVYLLAPLMDWRLSRLKKKKRLVAVSAVLMMLFSIDLVYSLGHPNMSRGAIEAQAPTMEAAVEQASPGPEAQYD